MNDSLLGQRLGNTWGGFSGREAEKKLKNQGVTLQNGPGADNYVNGKEYKTRDLDATSPVSIGTSTVSDLQNLSYEENHISEKLQNQKWFYHRDEIVIDEQDYDFSEQYIQEIFKADYQAAYEYFNSTSIRPPTVSGSWGYWEKVDSYNYKYRIAWQKMKKIKAISRQAKLFET